MPTVDSLAGRVILVVDDEPDVLDAVEGVLDMCSVHKAKDYDTGLQYILSYTYDAVVLDIMGVNGFELLKASLRRGFPTVMLTAHAVTPEALKKSMKLMSPYGPEQGRRVKITGYCKNEGSGVLIRTGKSFMNRPIGGRFNRWFLPGRLSASWGC
jgi:CheY-like chemotaxis protein